MGTEILPAADRPEHGPEKDGGAAPPRGSAVGRTKKEVLLPVAAILFLLLPAGTCRAGGRLLISGTSAQRVFDLPGETFGLSWIHSVERTGWRETFRITPSGAIALAASEFESGGAGLPGMPNGGEVVRLSGGKMRLTGSRLVVPDLRVQLSDLSHHYLRAGGPLIDLNAVFGEGTIVIRAEKTKKGGNDAKE